MMPVALPGLTIKRKPVAGRNGTNNRVALTEIYKGDLLSRVDVTDFPYDIQLLEIQLKSRPCRAAGTTKQKTVVVFRDPESFRYKDGRYAWMMWMRWLLFMLNEGGKTHLRSNTTLCPLTFAIDWSSLIVDSCI